MNRQIKSIFILFAIFIIGTAFPLFAENVIDEPLQIPITFENGKIADANDMNIVLQEIQKIVNQNRIIMFDYGSPEGIKKVFEKTNSPTTLMDIVSAPGVETWQDADGSKIEYLTENGIDGTLEIGRREYNTFGVMTQDLTYNPPMIGVDLAGSKEVGKIWGGAYIAKKPDGSIYGAETKMFSILALEDVTVPAGTFINCVKVYHTTGNYDSVAWYAEGIGMVKRIGVEGLFELLRIE